MPYIFAPQNQIQSVGTLPAVCPVEIGILLDRSGSMSSIKSETISGFNALLKEQQNLERDALLSVALFNDAATVLHDGVPIARVSLLSPETYQPRGGTALNDALGRMIGTIGERASRLSRNLIAIITDGQDTASHEFSVMDIRRMIGYRRERHSWTFVFFGPSSARRYARFIGIPDEFIFDFDVASEITTTLGRLSAGLADYRLGRGDFILRLKG
jgi:uncharacterized protein YegL